MTGEMCNGTSFFQQYTISRIPNIRYLRYQISRAKHGKYADRSVASDYGILQLKKSPPKVCLHIYSKGYLNIWTLETIFVYFDAFSLHIETQFQISKNVSLVLAIKNSLINGSLATRCSVPWAAAETCGCGGSPEQKHLNIVHHCSHRFLQGGFFTSPP